MPNLLQMKVSDFSALNIGFHHGQHDPGAISSFEFPGPRFPVRPSQNICQSGRVPGWAGVRQVTLSHLLVPSNDKVGVADIVPSLLYLGADDYFYNFIKRSHNN